MIEIVRKKPLGEKVVRKIPETIPSETTMVKKTKKKEKGIAKLKKKKNNPN